MVSLDELVYIVNRGHLETYSRITDSAG
jgi:hypothetical protein